MNELLIERIEAPTSEARELVCELERTLAAEYEPEQQHGLPLEAMFQPHIRFFIARRAHRALGCAGVALFDDFAEVKRMFVRESARGHGVARLLLERLEHEARARGLRDLRLETGDRQADAIRLYERAGFVRCAAFGDYLSMTPNAIATSIFYRKHLT